MQLNIKGMAVQVDDGQVANIVLQHFIGNASPSIQHALMHNIAIPPIGEIWPGQGGIYAGIMRGRDGKPDYHLIVGPAIAASTWDMTKVLATAIEIDGHKDFSLPFRAEQALQFANVSELFEKEWYWSCEQHAANSVRAWMQLFSDGNQHYDHKSDGYRARAVRRSII